ncbi:OmpH family outer membrane protein [Qipengyuania sp.]|uniref:OmpH family outer membrane protein n=1 Tax=Qipengyuania sp. TaxID=2004515 RepID=UPI0035C86C4B
MTKIFKLAAIALASTAMGVGAPAAAQVAGIATASPELAIARAAARNTGYQQIGTTYQAQITQIGTVRQEVATLQKSLDTNNDNQLSDAEINAKPNVVQQIQQKEQQLQQISQPITIAQTYVLDQLVREYDAALQQVVSAKKIQMMLSPDAIQWAPPAVDVTSDIVAALDARKPTVTTAVPAGWQPSQQVLQLQQGIQRILIAAAQQQQAQAQQVNQAQPTGR